MTKDLRARRAADLVQRLVAEGEHENQDFKLTVNDPRKIARTVSAFANHSGGHLLIGVNDNGVPRGVRSEEDIYVVEAAATIYCQPACTPTFTAYKAEGGVTIIRADIERAIRRPVCVREENDRLRAYYRIADENIMAHPLMVKAWKKADDPDKAIVFDLDSGRTSILNLLRDGAVTPEDLALRISMSKARLEDAIIDLTVMGLIDFSYINHRFHLTLL